MTYSVALDPKKILLGGAVFAWHLVNSKDSDPICRGFGIGDWLAFDCQVMEKAGGQM